MMQKFSVYLDNLRYGFYHSLAFALASFFIGVPTGGLIMIFLDWGFDIKINDTLFYGWIGLVGMWGIGFFRDKIND